MELFSRMTSQMTMEDCYKWAVYVFPVCHKHNSLPLGLIKPPSLSTEKLHALGSTFELKKKHTKKKFCAAN